MRFCDWSGRRRACFNGARHWGGKGTPRPMVLLAHHERLQWGPPLGRERDSASASALAISRFRFNGARHWGGKGTSTQSTVLLNRRCFNGARHWGGKGTVVELGGEVLNVQLQWGPPLGRERDSLPPCRISRPPRRFNGARHWGGKGTLLAPVTARISQECFNGARHWGGKGTDDVEPDAEHGDCASMGPATGAGKGQINY